MKDNWRNDSVFSKKVRAGKRRTYFFDVRRTRGNDYYITLTESTRKFDGENVERHKIFLYKEDFNRFLESLEETINYVRQELMPSFDYDEYTRRQEEWEQRRKAEKDHSENLQPEPDNENSSNTNNTQDQDHGPEDDDMSW